MSQPRIADDYAAIAQAMKGLERTRKPGFTIPPGVLIALSIPSRVALEHPDAPAADIVFVLTASFLKMVKSYTGSYLTRDGFDVQQALCEQFPSAVVGKDGTVMAGVIEFSDADADRLREIILASRA